ncbi:MAG: hypothetical protein E6314_04650 [Enterobacter sp.]|uniref:hypothetical protein n=1 Tax=Enterobacter sp. TaxID=42895 RepID=UPI002914B169|nr:hypothetical protein [Enterobacter sp.]MDU7097731.1 hypothetical protein [Enterobacter sp.]MDU7154829.1 hypothetical protein [Enterobacter sp.]
MITEKDNVFYCDCGFSFQRNRSGAHDCADGLRNKLAESEARCAALAAENAGLSAVLMSVIDPSNEPAYQSLGMGCGVEDNSLQTDGYGACEYGWREAMERVYSEVIPEELPETPATDAFLVEVRAQGVEMLVKHCEQKALEKSYDFFMDAGAVAAQFAAQLRQEAQ